MKVEVICKESNLGGMLGITLLSYEAAIRDAFRPLGLWGRLYWYSVLPFHGLIFREIISLRNLLLTDASF